MTAIIFFIIAMISLFFGALAHIAGDDKIEIFFGRLFLFSSIISLINYII